MSATHGSPRRWNERWKDAGAGRHYAGARWSSQRRAQRDPRLVERLLARTELAGARILDAPCGTGRLAAGLRPRASALVGLDVSRPMLAEARAAGVDAVQGDVRQLPFPDGSFDLVVCCRLLHHLAERSELDAVVRELVRVSRGLVAASFWDQSSLPGLRRRLGTKKGRGRVARTRRELSEAFDAAGAEVQSFAHSFRWVSQQTFALAAVTRQQAAAR
ncbi:MAG: class I SAM-dependent methyltransferase [Planctomycetota bacterium]